MQFNTSFDIFLLLGCKRSSHGVRTSEYHVHSHHHVRGERLQGATANFKSKERLDLSFIEFFPNELARNLWRHSTQLRLVARFHLLSFKNLSRQATFTFHP